MTVIKEALDPVPLCPYCESSLDEVAARPVDVARGAGAQIRFGKRYIYVCLHLPQSTEHLPPQGVLGGLNLIRSGQGCTSTR